MIGVLNTIRFVLWFAAENWYRYILPLSILVNYISNGLFLTRVQKERGSGQLWRCWIPGYAHVQLGNLVGMKREGISVCLAHAVMLVACLPDILIRIPGFLRLIFVVCTLVEREKIAGKIYNLAVPVSGKRYQATDVLTLGFTRGIRLLKCAKQRTFL